jgi:hypothetical protein
MSNKKHPIHTEHTRKFIAQHSFTQLIIYYIFINIVASLFFSILMLGTTDFNFIDIYKYNLFEILGQDTSIIEISHNSYNIIFNFIIRFLSILFPTVLLGLIVYKLFMIPNIFVFRDKISFFKNDRAENTLVIRFYNGTKLLLSPVNVEIYARVKKYRQTGEPHLENHKIFTKTWPISFPKVPFSIYLPCIQYDKEKRIFLVKYMNEEIEINQETVLFIMINGNISKLDKNFNEEHFITLKNISFNQFTDIHVDYDKPPSTWMGWNSFDN